jgi:hypothetical protein
MTSLKLAIVAAFALIATNAALAQQKFPLRSGEWEASTPDPTGPNKPPIVMLYCLNDELWTKALNNPSCQLQQLNITSSGGSYNLDCTMKSFQMKGSVKLSFDGMTHLISKGSFDTTSNGKTTHMDSTSEYRWKGPTCNPNADMNLKFNKH